MNTSDGPVVPAQRDRWHAPKRYPAQLILMTDEKTAVFVRTYASMLEQPYTAVLRDLVSRGVDTLESELRARIEARIEMSEEEDGDKGTQ